MAHYIRLHSLYLLTPNTKYRDVYSVQTVYNQPKNTEIYIFAYIAQPYTDHNCSIFILFRKKKKKMKKFFLRLCIYSCLCLFSLCSTTKKKNSCINKYSLFEGIIKCIRHFVQLFFFFTISIFRVNLSLRVCLHLKLYHLANYNTIWLELCGRIGTQGQGSRSRFVYTNLVCTKKKKL